MSSELLSCLSLGSPEETTVILIRMVVCNKMLWLLSNEFVCSACPRAFSWGTIEKVNCWIKSKCYKGLSNNSASFKILEKMNDWTWWIITDVVFQRNSQRSFETCWISSCCNFLAVCEVASSYFPKCSNNHKTGKAMLVVYVCFQVSL